MSLIELKNVSKSYNNIHLFEKVNIKIEKGGIYGVIGHNGSGKSVLFKMICGFIEPDEGEVIIDPAYRSKHSKFPDNFGIIIDRPGFIANKTGFENLRRLAQIQKKISDQDIIKTMKKVGLRHDATQKMKDYSLGMKQKIAISQAIMEDQEILILDEPFNALDIDSVEIIRALLLNFKKEGKTIILTSHNREDIDILCDRIFRIQNQKLEEVSNLDS